MQDSLSKERFGSRPRTAEHSPGQAGDAELLENIEPSSHVLSSRSSYELKGEIELGGRHYVRQQQLANILGVSSRTLARWGARGFGPPKITIGKTVLFDVAKLPEWLAARETAPTRNTRR